MTYSWFVHPFFLHLLNWNANECYQEARFEKEMRYYVMRLEKDLLNDWTVTIINGRIKTKLGQSRTLAYVHFAEAFEEFRLRANTRYQRGYALLSWQCDNFLFSALLLHLAVITTFEKPSKESKKRREPRLTAKTPPITAAKKSFLTVPQQKFFPFLALAE